MNTQPNNVTIHAIPKLLDADGKHVDAADPKRLLWYSAGCGFFTDDWNQLRTNGGIPCCPKCGCVGMQIEAGKWEEGAANHDKTHPHYLAFLATAKGTCFGRGGFMKAFEAFSKLENAKA